MTREKTDLSALPKTLGEFLDGKHAGFTKGAVFIPRLTTTLAGLYPTVYTGLRPVLAPFIDVDLVERAWRKLPKLHSGLKVMTGHLNVELGVAYVGYDRESGWAASPPVHLVTLGDVQALEAGELVIGWDPRCNGEEATPEEFDAGITVAMDAVRAYAKATA